MHVRIAAIVALGLLAGACTGPGGDDAPSVGGGAGGGGAAGSDAGRGGGGARGGGRGAPSIVLAASDVHTVARGTIERTVPLSGDLRPIEEIVIRSRVEGDLTAVLVREGESVAAGGVLARFDTTELAAAFESATADLAAAEGEQATADWNVEQARELLRAGAISEQAFRALEQGALAARARVAAARSRRQSAAVALRDAVVASPAEGTISQRHVQTGERVSRGAALFVLVRDDTLEFTAAVPARSAGDVRVGHDVRFVVDGRDHRGRVARVSPAIDPATRSVAVYVRVPNATRQLKANAFASGRLVVSESAGALVVPISAIRRTRLDDQTFVYVVQSGAIATASVELGATDDARGLVEIRGGISEGDRIVVGNVGTIGRGMQVQLLDTDRRPQ